MKHIYDHTAEYAARNPDKIAVSDERGAISYGELDRKSGAIAAHLARMGIKPGDAVAVYVSYDKELIVGAFAAMKAGGVFLPLEYTYPDERLAFMLSDASAAAILTLRSVWGTRPLNVPEDKVVFMDDGWEETAFLPVDVPPEAPAMILYTSGTTGRPKGVVLPHRMMVSLLDWAFIHEGTRLTETSVAGIMSGLTFSATTLILYSPLTVGGTVMLVPEAARKDIDLLYRFMREKGVTHIFMAAGLAATMAEFYDLSGINVFAGGEKLRNFRAFSPGTTLINTYGCTELGAVLSARIRGNESVIPVGRLDPGSAAMITDEDLHPVKPGEVGELLIRNSRMALCYLGLPEQTKAKWIEIDGERWYRTGDRARCTEDGTYYILGRTDNMVKLRGFRVETGEVEAQIGKAAAQLGNEIKNVAVVIRNVNGIDHLTCYYESPQEAETEKIAKAISAVLAGYMVPDIWVRVDAMPRNANGKIMRAQLPQPESRVSAVGTVYSEAEARTLEAAAAVLGIRSYISPNDGFAELGGNSLKAMELATTLRTMGISVGSAQILKLNTLRDIAAAAEITYEKFWTYEEYCQVREDFASRGEKIEKVLPITCEQDELLFDQIIHPDDSSLRFVFMLQVNSFLTENEVRAAFDTVAAEYEQLRAAIVFHRVTVFQQVITDRKLPVRMVELPGGDRSGLRAVYHMLEKRPCDLQRESGVQVVCTHADGESFLFVSDAMAKLHMPFTARFLARAMELLGQFHPEDESIADWSSIFALGLDDGDEPCPEAAESAKSRFIREMEKRAVPAGNIHVYSDQPGKKKIFFVHTGNTGSEAYYSLARRIRSDFSFSVFEPFNLYHRAEASYGIKNIAARYVEFLKKAQPEGPYILGGWCYGGMVAHEMACQLQAAGDTVEQLILLDSHVTVDKEARKAAEVMHSGTNEDYFRTSDLFAELRSRGMLEALVENSRHVGHDMITHVPSHYDGPCLYFKPETVPAASIGGAREYWVKMMTEYSAGGYEKYCSREQLTVVDTPYEHDLMMNSESLDIIVPEIYKALMK